MSFTVIIPSCTESNILPCIAAVREHEPEARIIVVWDASRTGTMPTTLHSVTTVPVLEKFIFSRNVNIGIRRAGFDDVVVLNDDALLKSPGGFTLLGKESELHPEIGIIGATTNITGQKLQFRKNVGLRIVPEIAFVCVYIPRRTIEQIGMLDERYCIDYGVEDKDYCEACSRAGLKIAVHDGCYVDHGSLVSTFRGNPKTPLSFQKNLALFNEKWGLVKA